MGLFAPWCFLRWVRTQCMSASNEDPTGTSESTQPDHTIHDIGTRNHRDKSDRDNSLTYTHHTKHASRVGQCTHYLRQASSCLGIILMQEHIFQTLSAINISRPRQNRRHWTDIFKCIFFNENVWILLKVSLRFVLKVWINNIPALVQIMVWCRPCKKPLSATMMVSLLTHTYTSLAINELNMTSKQNGYHCVDNSLIAFSLMKITLFGYKFHVSLLLRVHWQ